MATGDLVAWASSGAMALTGAADGWPRPEPARVASAANAAANDVASMTARFGIRVDVDGPALLGERAAIAGMGRNGTVSVGGAARFERAADGWVVVNLPRPSDSELLPALVNEAIDPHDWGAVRREFARHAAATLVARGAELGLAIAQPDECAPLVSPGRALARGTWRAPVDRPLIVDLSSLWAGPLAGSLLAAAGARVIKVEGRHRPDGARAGAVQFFDVLNAGKECLALDFDDRDDIRLLRRLITAADLVIEGSRPRAMDQLGIDPVAALERSATSWVSITGHGRSDQPLRVGFGDDAAVGGGLWVDSGAAPHFVADAVADPLAGLAAAAFGAEILASDRPAVIDVALVRAAAWANRAALPAEVGGDDASGWWVMVEGERVPVSPPRGRTPTQRAAELDGHGPALRAEFAER
ncbi:MAG: CoA transferase [Actinomycetota bacterium]